jgi:uncharacterized delta-60 repeat protein
MQTQVNQEWTARYNGPGNGTDFPYVIKADNTGNVIVTGYTFDSVSGFDYTTNKYSPLGVLLWSKRYSGANNQEDIAWAMAIDGTGNVYVTGYSTEIPTGNQNITTIKYNSAGSQQWLQSYNSPGNGSDGGFSIAVDVSGNVYVAGVAGYTNPQCIVLKYNSSGTLQWTARFYSGNVGDRGSSLVLDQSGNIYVSAVSIVTQNINKDIVTIKYAPTGDSLWVRRYSGPGARYDEPFDIDVDGSGNTYVAGYTQLSDSNYDFLTIKYLSNGSDGWVRTYSGPGGNGMDWASALYAEASGSVCVTGIIEITENTNYDYATLKYNSSGILQWARTYDGPNSGVDHSYAIVTDVSGNVYVTGMSEGDYFTIKYNSGGAQQWTQRYDGPSSLSDMATSIVVDNLNNVYVTGYSGEFNTQEDFLTIKYSQSIGIYPISSEIPDQFSLSQNYPNPFNPMTHFEFRIADFELVNLSIFDILGREVETIVNQELNPGTYETEWNAGNYPSGIYFYSMNAGEFTATRKMLLIK